MPSCARSCVGNIHPWRTSVRHFFLETVLYSFCSQTNCADGNQPTTGLVVDAAGNVYGTAGGSPNGFGVVFKISPQ